jgi:antirestriction protein ArdC
MNVYEIITARIIAQLESGIALWRKPWTSKAPANLCSQKEYRGLNVLSLASQGYPSRFWLTFNQANKLGGHIGKGQKGSLVVYWNVGEEREVSRPDGTTRKQTPFLLRYSTVFNLSQTEGLKIPASALHEERTNNPIADCESLVHGMPNRPDMVQSDKAWYAPKQDTVGMPSRGLFHSSEEYYSTLFHELAHSTGHKSRVAREWVDNPVHFGSEDYSKEELVAERMCCRYALRSNGNRYSYPRQFCGLLTVMDCPSQVGFQAHRTGRQRSAEGRRLHPECGRKFK